MGRPTCGGAFRLPLYVLADDPRRQRGFPSRPITVTLGFLILFLNAERMDKFLSSVLEAVKEKPRERLEQPTTLQGMLATWWKLGIHPLRDENG